MHPSKISSVALATFYRRALWFQDAPRGDRDQTFTFRALVDRIWSHGEKTIGEIMDQVESAENGVLELTVIDRDTTLETHYRFVICGEVVRGHKIRVWIDPDHNGFKGLAITDGEDGSLAVTWGVSPTQAYQDALALATARLKEAR